MALPHSPEARQFLQSARQRLRDAEILLEAGRTTGAVYMAGYTVEGALKALLLEATPKSLRLTTREGFRSAKAHDFSWLKGRYFKIGGPLLPKELVGWFDAVDYWKTKMRYQASAIAQTKAELFIKATRAILEWAEGRF